MVYEELTVLVPSHSLEDFPTDLAEGPAEGLLNAFAILWHPLLLASAGAMPRWQRADESHDVGPNRLIVIPTASEDWVPHGWMDGAREAGSVVLSGITGREELLAAALGPLERDPVPDTDLAADFLALGSCWLQIELLTRHMRNFSNLDEVHLQREAVAAAKAAVSDDRVAAETHLRNCFEMLLEARERFYPVDCFLIDLCLLIPRLANKHFVAMLSAGRTSVNVLATVRDLKEIVEALDQDADDLLRAGVRDGRIDVVGGEWSEPATPLMAIDSAIRELERGTRALESLLGKRPATWGRRRYGVGPQMPQLLSRFGFTSALHFVMDDGIYPDDEQSQFRWEGCDGSVIDAISRIPLAADSASSFLRFPVRMSESMDQDHTAAVVFARWPEMRTPWLEDFHRTQKYAPVLGRFITLHDFFERSDVPGRLSSFSAGQYMTPFLVQSVAREEADPVSRYIDYWSRRRDFEALEWAEHLSQLLRKGRIAGAEYRKLEDAVEEATPEATNEALEACQDALDSLRDRSPASLAELLNGRSDRGGLLLLNSLPFTRQVMVDWPSGTPLPARDDAVQGTQEDEGGRTLRVSLPGSGFHWIPYPAQETPPAAEKLPTAEDLLLRNEFFEVNLSDVTGGIGQIRTYERSPNRISQQLAYRFPRERTITIGEGEQQEQYRTYYSEMVLDSTRVLRSGSVVGEIETTGKIVDPEAREYLAGYRQVTRIWRGKPLLEVEFELDPVKLPDGNPWTNYYGVRFAWKHETAAISRSQHHGAHVVTAERFEAPEFIELADDEFRTTILTCGLPFHRKTGPRMLDTIVLTAGESRRTFRFAVAVDQQYPLECARDLETPPICVPTTTGPADGAATGWFFHVSSRNVQITRVLPMLPGKEGAADLSGCRLRLMETEGRRKSITLRCFRAPTSARQHDFLGETLQTLPVEGDKVSLEVGRFEVCDIEFRFDT